MKVLVLDIEAKQRVEDWDRPWEAGMALCCAWTSWGAGKWGRFRFYQDHDEDLQRLHAAVRAADLVVTYNGERYDMRVLKHLDPTLHWAEHCDLMEHVVAAIGHCLSLEAVARATLGRGKSGHGLGALEYYRLGYWGQLCTYCMDDVLLTRDLFFYARTHGMLWRMDGDQRVPIPMSVPGGVEHIQPVRSKKPYKRRGVGA